MKLFYRKYGSGPPLIILHGLYGSSDNWIPIAKMISGNFTIYIPDIRNHGKSPHSGIHNYDAISDDISELTEELGFENIFLAGHSMGGKAAVRFAMRWPDKIKGLLIADIAPFTDEKKISDAYDQHYSILSAMLNTDIESADSRDIIENLLARQISSDKIRGFIMKNLQRNEDNRFSWKLNVHALLENLPGILASLPYEGALQYPLTGFPVTFLKGENSAYLDTEDFREILRFFPAAELKIIENTGHWLHAENPDAVAKALLELL